MSDAATIALAIAVWSAAQLAAPVPLVCGVIASMGGLVARSGLLLALGAALLASGCAARALEPLEARSSHEVAGWAVLVGDPVDERGGLRVELRIGGRHLEAWARGRVASALRPRLAGELIELRGRVAPLSPSSRRSLVPRHIAGRLDIAETGDWRVGSPVTRFANGVRRTLDHGARPLDDDSRSLLLGVVLGDDRGRPVELTDDFRAAGLSHLLAVSGQNVAFVLTLAGPLLRRLEPRPRWTTTMGLLVLFGVLTRWEPSVVRVAAMAVMACTVSTLGRPSSRLRLLALAVTAAVLLDPLLVRSLGFQLSVGATAGIALFARPVDARLRGPRWLRETLAVTIAAEVGVLPAALPVFGGIPVASLPANVLATPVVAPLTVWGLTAGPVAGRAGPPWDGWLHVPTRWLTDWLAGVADWAAGLPLGTLRAPHLLLLTVLVAAIWLVRRGWHAIMSA